MPELATTLGALISAGAGRLRQSGLPDGRREAIRIWDELGESGPADVALEPARAVDGDASAAFDRAIARRCQGEPLSHVTGRSGFRRLSLVSDGRALIPRPETEGLVDLLLQRVHAGRVVDVGTGSGCIALSLAQEGHFDEVVAIDRSADAVALAQLNCNATGLQMTLVRGDLCEPLRHGAFNALISNPPYLTVAEYLSLDPSVRNWEPEAALVSGTDGMAATTRLLQNGGEVLQPGGWLALEVDCSRAAAAAAQAKALGWHGVSIHMDLFGRERYLLAQRSNTR